MEWGVSWKIKIGSAWKNGKCRSAGGMSGAAARTGDLREIMNKKIYCETRRRGG